MPTKKCDNHNPAAKLLLRSHFLNKYHADTPPDVMDCCQGGGVLWTELRKTHAVASYWGLDLKPKKGRLKIDSVRVLQQPGWPQNVIDIDTYGSPWKHWVAMLPNITKPTTVFLTMAWVISAGFQQYDRTTVAAVGITESMATIAPKSIMAAISRYAVDYSLAIAHEHCQLVEAAEAVSSGNARYIGCHLIPK